MKAVMGLTKWGTCTRIIFCSGIANSLAYQNNTIAAGFDNFDIIFFGALTGSQTAVLSGHTGPVKSLAFSLDGTFLVSGSSDGTVKLWDVQTGRAIKTLYGHKKAVTSVSISVDNTMIASGSDDETIHLWNIKAGGYCIMEGCGHIETVTFSPTNPQLLLASSAHGIMQQWDTNGHQIGSSVHGHHPVFSPDGTQFVSHKDTTVTIRNTNSRLVVVEFNLTKAPIHYCLSPDGRFIAVAADCDGIIYLWDITSPKPSLIQNLIGHISEIRSLVFSSSLTLTSASMDNSVRFWQINTLPSDSSISDIESTPPTSAPIRSVSLQTKDGLAFSLDKRGVVKTWDISTGCCKESYQTGAQGMHLGDMQLIGSRLILVWHREGTEDIYIEDIGQGVLQTLHVPPWSTGGLRIAGDKSRILHVGGGLIQAWDMWTGESMGKKNISRNFHYFSSLQMDGSKVLVCSSESVQGWDFGALGSTPIQFSVTSSARPCLNLIETKDVIRDRITQVRIQDGVTGKEVFQLCGRYARPHAMQWDGQYLIAGYFSGEVVILDFSHVLSK